MNYVLYNFVMDNFHGINFQSYIFHGAFFHDYGCDLKTSDVYNYHISWVQVAFPIDTSDMFHNNIWHFYRYMCHFPWYHVTTFTHKKLSYMVKIKQNYKVKNLKMAIKKLIILILCTQKKILNKFHFERFSKGHNKIWIKGFYISNHTFCPFYHVMCCFARKNFHDVQLQGFTFWNFFIKKIVVQKCMV